MPKLQKEESSQIDGNWFVDNGTFDRLKEPAEFERIKSNEYCEEK